MQPLSEEGEIQFISESRMIFSYFKGRIQFYIPQCLEYIVLYFLGE